MDMFGGNLRPSHKCQLMLDLDKRIIPIYLMPSFVVSDCTPKADRDKRVGLLVGYHTQAAASFSSPVLLARSFQKPLP